MLQCSYSLVYFQELIPSSSIPNYYIFPPGTNLECAEGPELVITMTQMIYQQGVKVSNFSTQACIFPEGE